MLDLSQGGLIKPPPVTEAAALGSIDGKCKSCRLEVAPDFPLFSRSFRDCSSGQSRQHAVSFASRVHQTSIGQ